MYANQQVSALRKEGKLDEALQVGMAALAESSDDIWLKRAVAWVHYDFIKQFVHTIESHQKKNERPPANLVNNVAEHARNYARLKLPRPDMAFSNIARVLTGVGRHLDFYVPFLGWAGFESFSQEDYQPYVTDKGESSSLVTKVTREAIAWGESHPAQLQEWSSFLLELATHALQKTSDSQSNKIWLLYDRAALLIRLNRLDDAAKDMRSVLKVKRNEYWAWARMGEVETARSPDLAIACYAQAMCCQPDPKFTGKLHLHFGKLLHQQGNLAAAIPEYLAAAEVYQSQGWKFPEQLEAVLQAPWFDPGSANTDQTSFYRDHAEAALSLCYERVLRLNANFLEERVLQKNNKTRALLAIEGGDSPEQMLIRWPRSRPRKVHSGDAVTLIVGENDDSSTVLAVETRDNGLPWDCLTHGEGLVDSMNKDGTRGGIYLSRDTRAVLLAQPDTEDRPLQTGDSVEVWYCRNPVKENRLEVFHARRMDRLPDIPDLAVKEGELRVHEKGFAFVEDVFVPPHLVVQELNGYEVTAVCVQDFNKTKNTYGWKAVRLSVASDAN